MGMGFPCRGLGYMAAATLTLPVVGVASPAMATAAAKTGHAASIPHGWRSYSYQGARISVPNDWAVVRGGNCQNRSTPGTLYLGMPTQPWLCSSVLANANTVTLSSLPGRVDPFLDSCPRIQVHDLNVMVGPCTSSNAAGIVLYLIPALRLEAEGTGTSGENVTGPGADTIVGRVLHTLRSA